MRPWISEFIRDGSDRHIVAEYGERGALAAVVLYMKSRYWGVLLSEPDKVHGSETFNGARMWCIESLELSGFNVEPAAGGAHV